MGRTVAYNDWAMEGAAIVIYVCRRCLTPSGEFDLCRYCNGEKVACHPGAEGDPLRRPMVDAKGRVLTRAPIWWLHYTMPQLVERMN